MELLDRYLQAVKKHLPGKRQEDIIAELRANLESQLEEREAEAGRPLTDSEAEAWIKQLGSPMQMAARYQPQQCLIGPGIFPVYWYVLRLALFWAAIISVIVNVVLIAVNFSSAQVATVDLVATLFRVPSTLLTTAAWITLIFALIEFLGMHHPETVRGMTDWPVEWNPNSLPPIDKSAIPGKKQPSFAKAVAQVIFEFLFLIWLLLVPHYPYLMFGPGVFYMQISRFQLAPVWVEFFWCVVALNALQVVWHTLDLWRGSWQKPRTLQRIVYKAFGLVPTLLLWNASNQILVSLKDPKVDPQHLGPTLDLVNRSVHRGLAVVCAIIVLQLVWEIGKAVWERYWGGSTQ